MSDKNKITILEHVSAESVAQLRENHEARAKGKIIDFPGTVAVFQFRDWSDEYRMIFKSEPPSLNPPIPEGQRKTEYLTAHAARQLVASCEFVSLKHGGYTTFLTLTFDAEARARLDNGATIQSEVSRFFDSIQKVYQRGWQYKPGDLLEKIETDTNGEAIKKIVIPGHNEPLKYLWVAENPKNTSGENNPHVHVLMRWNVEYQHFNAWAARIEKLWGQGFAHLEKLRSRKREAAAGYLMKALQYLKKAAGGSDQGLIYGNRYGISESARAPGWQYVTSYAWHIAGKLIEKARFIQRNKLRPLEKQRDAIKAGIDQVSDKQSMNKLKNALNKVREKITETKGAVFFGRNQVVCAGEGAANKFLSWLKKRGWVGLDRPLPIYFDMLKKKTERMAREMKKQFSYALSSEWWQSLQFDNELNPYMEKTTI